MSVRRAGHGKLRPGGKSGPMKPASRTPQPASRFHRGVRPYTDSWAEFTYEDQLTEENWQKYDIPETR
jgi:hypothetical protein